VSTKPTPARVLVVDDDARMRQVIQWALEDEGYAVVAAEHAEQAVAGQLRAVTATRRCRSCW